jgi:hypothetical protein
MFINEVREANIFGPVDDREGNGDICVILPNPLAHDEFVDVQIQKGTDNGVSVEGMIIGASGEIHDLLLIGSVLCGRT